MICHRAVRRSAIPARVLCGALLLPALLAPGAGAQAPGFVIETIAGVGPPDLGDGRPARTGFLEQPLGVVAAGNGSIYVVDTYNNRIRRVGPDGIMTTVAGTGSGETRDWGDGLPAAEAQLRLPRSAKVAPDGTLWIVDTNNYRIRRIDADGIMRTVMGGGGATDNPPDDVPALGAASSGPMDIAFDRDGNYYIADSAANRIRRVGRDGVIRLAAQVPQPQSLAFDGRGGLIIACLDGGPLRRLDLSTGAVTLIEAARGRFATTDEAGNVFFVSGLQVYRLDAGTGNVTHIAGRSGPSGFAGDDGPARDAVLNAPARLSVAASGELYIADSGNDRVRRVAVDGRITTVAGSGPLPSENLPAAQAVVFDAQGIATDARGGVFFTDFLHWTIRKVDENRMVKTVAGGRRATSLADDIHPLESSIGTPSKILFDRFGNLLVLDQAQSVGVVRIITPGADGVVNGSADERIKTIAGQYRPRSEADRGQADGRPARTAVFSAARAIALDSRGRLLIADVIDHRLRMVVPGADGVFNGGTDEIISTIAGTGAPASSGDGGPATEASLFAPGGYGGLAVDRQDNVYVIDNTRRIRRIDGQTGRIQSVFTSTDAIWSIEFDQDGWGYLTESTRIRRFHPDNSIAAAVVAGGTEAGFSGDGGPATSATMRGAQFLSIDGRGDVYFPDNGNFRLRRLRRP